MIEELLFPCRRRKTAPDRLIPRARPWGTGGRSEAYGVVCFFGVVFGIGSAPAGEAAGASWKAFAKTRATIVLSDRKPRLFYAKAA